MSRRNCKPAEIIAKLRQFGVSRSLGWAMVDAIRSIGTDNDCVGRFLPHDLAPLRPTLALDTP